MSNLGTKYLWHITIVPCSSRLVTRHNSIITFCILNILIMRSNKRNYFLTSLLLFQCINFFLWSEMKYFSRKVFSVFNNKISLTNATFLNSRHMKYLTDVRKRLDRSSYSSEGRNGRSIPGWLRGNRGCQTINVTAESSDSVCTPHHPGRAFDVEAHGYPLPTAFERALSIPISRHHDILLLIRRHRPSPISSIPLSGIPEGRATLLHNRSAATRSSRDRHQDVSFSDCLVSVSPTAQRRITDAHTGEITRRKKIYSRKRTQHFNVVELQLIWIKADRYEFTKTKIKRDSTHFQFFPFYFNKDALYPRKFYSVYSRCRYNDLFYLKELPIFAIQFLAR